MKRFLPFAVLLAAAAVAAPVVAAQPDNAVNITAKPTKVVFGKATVLSGQVTGSGNGGVSVTLQGTPAPYTSGFKNVADATTDAGGFYSFTVTPQASTRYRVSAKAKPTIDSTPVDVAVALRVTMRVGDSTPRRGQRVRFAGTVMPAHEGRAAELQRRTSNGYKTISSAPLVATTPFNGVARQKYAHHVRVRRTGTYRVVVKSSDADHADGKSRKRRLRTH